MYLCVFIWVMGGGKNALIVVTTSEDILMFGDNDIISAFYHVISHSLLAHLRIKVIILFHRLSEQLHLSRSEVARLQRQAQEYRQEIDGFLAIDVNTTSIKGFCLFFVCEKHKCSY